jgi:hypothetical protein
MQDHLGECRGIQRIKGNKRKYRGIKENTGEYRRI